MVEQFSLGLLQQVGKTHWQFRVPAVHGFNASRHPDEFRQLFAVHSVVTRQDEVDQRGWRAGPFRGQFVAAL